MPDRGLTAQPERPLDGQGSPSLAPEGAREASASTGQTFLPSGAQAPSGDALMVFVEDQSPSVLSRPERDRLVHLWGREPNLTPGEAQERDLLEARMRVGIPEETLARVSQLEGILRRAENCLVCVAIADPIEVANNTLAILAERHLSSLEQEMLDALDRLWNRWDKLDEQDAPELTAKTEQLVTNGTGLAGSPELAPALLDALECHSWRWDELDEEDAPVLGASMREVIEKAKGAGVVAAPLPKAPSVALEPVSMEDRSHA